MSKLKELYTEREELNEKIKVEEQKEVDRLVREGRLDKKYERYTLDTLKTRGFLFFDGKKYRSTK